MHKHAVEVLCALMLCCLIAGLLGCQPAQPAPRTLSKFDANIVSGILTHDLELTNKNDMLLSQVDLTITVYFETDIQTRTRHWGYWKQGETQTVNVPASRVQRVVIEGSAHAGQTGERVQLKADWLMKYEKAN